jgi:hypothetical protein
MRVNLDFAKLEREAKRMLMDEWKMEYPEKYAAMRAAEEDKDQELVAFYEADREEYVESAMDDVISDLVDEETLNKNPLGARGLRQSDFI